MVFDNISRWLKYIYVLRRVKSVEIFLQYIVLAHGAAYEIQFCSKCGEEQCTGIHVDVKVWLISKSCSFVCCVKVTFADKPTNSRHKYNESTGMAIPLSVKNKVRLNQVYYHYYLHSKNNESSQRHQQKWTAIFRSCK